MKKIISLSIFAFLFGSIYGQTREIAHKSLSGTTNNFKATNYNDNLGMVEFIPHLDSVEKISYNTVVEYWHIQYSVDKHTDTVISLNYAKFPTAKIDSIYQSGKFHNSIVSLKGFKEKTWSKKEYYKRKSKKINSRYPKKDNNLWLFVFVAGGIMLLSKTRKVLTKPLS